MNDTIYSEDFARIDWDDEANLWTHTAMEAHYAGNTLGEGAYDLVAQACGRVADGEALFSVVLSLSEARAEAEAEYRWYDEADFRGAVEIMRRHYITPYLTVGAQAQALHEAQSK